MGDDDVLGVGDGKVSAASEPCSVCLDLVTDNGDRSWAKLQCGHQFHLDCIGSAFNNKGAMQCPNCRKIEKGRWLYANGSRSLPDFIMDDWAHDEGLHDDLSHSDMLRGVHYCPFSGIRLRAPFEEDEFSSAAFFDGRTPVILTSHPCPNISYAHPFSSASSASFSDGSSFNSHQSGPSAPNQSIPIVARTSRNSSDVPRPGMHPFISDHSSASTAPSSVTLPIIPPFTGTASQPSDHSSVPAYFQQSTGNPAARTPVISNRQRSSNRRGLPEVAPRAASSDQHGYFFQVSASGQTFREAGSPRTHFDSWDQQRQTSFPLSQVDRDPIWVPLNPPFATSDTGTRPSTFFQRHGSQRIPSHNWS